MQSQLVRRMYYIFSSLSIITTVFAAAPEDISSAFLALRTTWDPTDRSRTLIFLYKKPSIPIRKQRHALITLLIKLLSYVVLITYCK